MSIFLSLSSPFLVLSSQLCVLLPPVLSSLSLFSSLQSYSLSVLLSVSVSSASLSPLSLPNPPPSLPLSSLFHLYGFDISSLIMAKLFISV